MRKSPLAEALDAASKSAEAPWLAIGPRAQRALERDLLGAGTIETVGDVHAALATLQERRFAGCVAEARLLADRPARALSLLKTRLEPAPLVLVARRLPPTLRAAAAELRVPVVRQAGARPRVGRQPPRLLRADAAPQAPVREDDEASFAAALLAHVERPAQLEVFVLDAMRKRAGAGRASLMLLESGRRTLCLRHARGVDEALLGKVRCALGSGLAGRAAQLARPLAGYGSPGGPRAYAGRAYVVLPLGAPGRVSGVLSLTDLPGDELPGSETLQAWSRCAQVAGQALSAAGRLHQAESLSTTDPLTSLPNRRAFERALGREVERARRTGAGLAMAILDLDRFKRVNDRYGHQVGDRLLIEVAARLAEAFRESDLVARWGGEEFAVLLPGLAGRAEVQRALARARQLVTQRPVALGPALPAERVTFSAGAACLADGDARTLVKAADEALYAAKEGGRDRIEVA